MPPSPCINCPGSHLGLNGRYCRRHSRYVEHLLNPPCAAIVSAEETQTIESVMKQPPRGVNATEP